jgi:hypothetical protein
LSKSSPNISMDARIKSGHDEWRAYSSGSTLTIEAP